MQLLKQIQVFKLLRITLNKTIAVNHVVYDDLYSHLFNTHTHVTSSRQVAYANV